MHILLCLSAGLMDGRSIGLRRYLLPVEAGKPLGYNSSGNTINVWGLGRGSLLAGEYASVFVLLIYSIIITETLSQQHASRNMHIVTHALNYV